MNKKYSIVLDSNVCYLLINNHYCRSNCRAGYRVKWIILGIFEEYNGWLEEVKTKMSGELSPW